MGFCPHNGLLDPAVLEGEVARHVRRPHRRMLGGAIYEESAHFGRIFATFIMREVHRSQFQLGQVPIEEIWINLDKPEIAG